MNQAEALAVELSELSRQVSMGPEQIATALGVTCSEALELWWGQRPLTAQQHARWCHLVNIEPDTVLALAELAMAQRQLQ